ncbi:MAG: PKD domain-containing protein, partial [Myxococcota bacterium]
DALIDEGDTATFTAMAESNDAITYRWDFGDGSPPLVDEEATEVTHTYGDNGTYDVVLTVTDEDSITTEALRRIHVANRPPTIDRITAPASGNEGEPLTIVVEASDPALGADPLTIRWDFGDGSGPISGEEVSFAFAEDGLYTAALVVSDDDGGQAQTVRTLHIQNVAPIIDPIVLPPEAFEGSELLLSATASDPAGAQDPLLFQWELGDGTERSGADIGHTYADDGTYAATVTVTDDDGGLSQRTAMIAVGNVTPTVMELSSPDQGIEGQPLNMQLTFTDPGDDPPVITWNFGDGSPLQTGLNLNNVTHVYADDGTYTLSVTLRDGDGGQLEQEATVVITNANPTITQLTGNTSGSEGTLFEFSAAASDPAGVRDALTYIWDFGDGSPPIVGRDRTQIAHLYETDGSFTLTLTVQDDDGGAQSQTLSVGVSNVSPTITVLHTGPGVEGSPTFLSARVTDPADPISVTWNFGDGTPVVSGTGRTEVTHVYANDGTYTVRITASDGSTSTLRDFTVRIDNTPPRLTSRPALFATTGLAYITTIEAYDAGNDPLTFGLLEGPEGMTLNADTGVLSWIPGEADQDPLVRIQVQDNAGATATQQWVIALDPADQDMDGSPDRCEERYSVSENPLLSPLNSNDPCDGDEGEDACPTIPRLDNDMDGISNTQECLAGTHPLVSNGPEAPTIAAPANNTQVDGEPVVLQVINAVDPDQDPLTYTFQLYSSPDLTLDVLVFEEPDVQEQAERTQLEVPVDLMEDTSYWWRRCSKGWWCGRPKRVPATSPWSSVATFRLSLINDPPTTPVGVSPSGTLSTDQRRPTCVVNNSTDPEGDTIVYLFTLSTDTEPPLFVISSPPVAAAVGDTTSWSLPADEPPLSVNVPYR